ncbi:NfeD family protein [Trichothermofontia sp.]
MSTLLDLLAWLLPQRQAEAQSTPGLLAEPQNVFANYRHGRAIVESLILPGQSGRVWFKASWWPARCPLGIALYQGQAVRVIDIDRITLIVEPIPEAMPESLTVSPDARPTFTLTSPAAPVREPDLGARVKPGSAPVSPPAYPAEYPRQSVR